MEPMVAETDLVNVRRATGRRWRSVEPNSHLERNPRRRHSLSENFGVENVTGQIHVFSPCYLLFYILHPIALECFCDGPIGRTAYSPIRRY